MPNTRYSTAAVIAEFRAHGAEPTFTSYTGPSQRLTFLCSCPDRRPGETTFRALHYQGVAPRCPECRTLARQGRILGNRRTPSTSPAPKARPPTDRGEVVAEKYRLLFVQHGVEPLSEYGGARTPIIFMCPGRECGGARHSIMPAALRNGQVPRCPSCQKAARPRGSAHHRWNDARSPEERENDRSKAWEAAVLRAHNTRCVITRRVGRAPHHMYGHAGYPGFRLLLQNGVCLTRTLHDEFTARHRDGRNTYADFAAFFEEKTGRACTIPDPMSLRMSERIFVG